MSHAPSPILDYASPKPRMKMRLPSRSVLRTRIDPGGRGVTVIERIETIGSALGAMVFAVFVLGVLLILILTSAVPRWRRGHWDDPGGIMFTLLFLAEAAALVAVIGQTWQRTVLEVRNGIMELRFISIFGNRTYRWTLDQINGLGTVATQSGAGMFSLAELQFHVADGTPVHLFTDHRAQDVAQIHAAIERMLPARDEK